MQINVRDITFQVNELFNKPFWDYLNSGEWEEETFNIIDYFVSKNDVVLDIGCWTGPLSLYMAGKNANVYSIDPDPIAYKELLINLELNPTLNKNISPFNIAISPTDKELTLHARKSYGVSSSSIVNRVRDTAHERKVEGVSLSKLAGLNSLKTVDFIKMDIEGGEFEVLRDIELALGNMNNPTIYVAFHYSQLNESIYQKRIGNKYLSLFCMKVEKMLGVNLFRKELFRIIKDSIRFSEHYDYIYTEYGNEIKLAHLTPDLLFKNKYNLVFTNKKWDKV